MAAMINKEDILWEDKHIIVCRKPAGLAVQTAGAGTMDLVSMIKNYLRTPYLGLVHRLDQPVEGLLVFAKTQQAAAELSRQNREHFMGKRYYALALAGRDSSGDRDSGWHVLEDFLKKEEKGNLSRVAAKGEAGGKRARLQYQKVQELATESGTLLLLKIELETGRHHQIRVQMAHHGMPLLSDRKYGSEASVKEGIRCGIRDVALCCYELEFCHPVTKKKMSFSLQPSWNLFSSEFHASDAIN